MTFVIVSLLVGLSLTRAQAGEAQPVSPIRLAPQVLVHDQALVADQVTVAEVVALEAGWVVIHRSQAGNLDSRDWAWRRSRWASPGI